jgi:uncharacterized protein YnzC (UPF0291/DUF896 family)
MVNYYSSVAKERDLTEEEVIDRQKYRTLYIEQFKMQVRGHLDNVKVVDEEGNEIKLNKKDKIKN